MKSAPPQELREARFPVMDVQFLFDEKGNLKEELLALDVGAVNG
jgi:hypothetical protein